jgi:hypothetical protein
VIRGIQQRHTITGRRGAQSGKKSEPKQIAHPAETHGKTALNKRPQNEQRTVQRRTTMNINSLRNGFIVAALLAGSGAFSGPGYHGWYSTGVALAASAQEKAQARSSLNQVTAALRSVDTAYASGNAAEAQTKFEEARANWDKTLR